MNKLVQREIIALKDRELEIRKESREFLSQIGHISVRISAVQQLASDEQLQAWMREWVPEYDRFRVETEVFLKTLMDEKDSIVTQKREADARVRRTRQCIETRVAERNQVVADLGV